MEKDGIGLYWISHSREMASLTDTHLDGPIKERLLGACAIVFMGFSYG